MSAELRNSKRWRSTYLIVLPCNGYDSAEAGEDSYKPNGLDCCVPQRSFKEPHDERARWEDQKEGNAHEGSMNPWRMEAHSLGVKRRRSPGVRERSVSWREFEVRNIGCWHSAVPARVVGGVSHVNGELAIEVVARDACLWRVRPEIFLRSQREDEWLIGGSGVQEARCPL